MLKLLLFTAATLFSFASLAQDFPESQYSDSEVQMKKYDKDTSAHAVVLKEFGKAWVSSEDYAPVAYHYHVKIKIFDSKGYDEGNVEVLLRHQNKDDLETISDVKGSTYYTDDKGNAKIVELDIEKVYHTTYNRFYESAKFAMPNLRKGCIIEYSYTVKSPNHWNFHKWEFQSDIPKIHSEFNTHIPSIFKYDITLRGALKFTKKTDELERNCLSVGDLTCDCTNSTYVMSDIPAFVAEGFMTAPSNFKSAIYFELASAMSYEGVKTKYTKEWKDVDLILKKDDDFSGQIARKDLLKERIPQTLWKMTDTLDKAKAIYAYLQKWFRCNDIRGIDSEFGIKKALDAHSASVADINLSLIAALSAAGINTEAVILSTRDNGIVKKSYPVLSDFDYVIAKANIGGRSFLLDATDPMLPFDLLPMRCINDQGRVISLNKPSYWIDLVQTEKNNTISSLNLVLQPDGKVKGTITTYSIGYAAYEKRLLVKKFNSVDEYLENRSEGLIRYKVLKSEITGIDSLDMPITETYEIEVNAYNDLNKGRYAFNPAFWSQETVNPFKLQDRTYPVDIGSAWSETLSVTLTYPNNLTVTAQPSPVGIVLPNKGGSFITNIDVQPGIIKYSQITQLNKAIYSPEEYKYLKEFHNQIIQTEKATVVFKTP